jgi:DNA-3-methyladenine glycosylase
MHWMLNVVTGESGYPAAVLIRSVEIISGPGRLTRAVRITGALNGLPATKRTGLWFVDAKPPPDVQVIHTAWIGVGYAGPFWSVQKYRYILETYGPDTSAS